MTLKTCIDEDNIIANTVTSAKSGSFTRTSIQRQNLLMVSDYEIRFRSNIDITEIEGSPNKVPINAKL